jgi:hypothetical protein
MPIIKGNIVCHLDKMTGWLNIGKGESESHRVQFRTPVIFEQRCHAIIHEYAKIAKTYAAGKVIFNLGEIEITV